MAPRDLSEGVERDIERLYRESAPQLWRAIYGFAGGRRHLAEDAVAEAFARAIERAWDSPAGAVAARPQGWIAVRGTLSVASDGFVQLCSQLDGERCQDAAVVRGIDGVGLMVNVLQRYPGTGYEKPHVWLAQVRGDVLDDLAIGDIRTTG